MRIDSQSEGTDCKIRNNDLTLLFFENPHVPLELSRYGGISKTLLKPVLERNVMINMKKIICFTSRYIRITSTYLNKFKKWYILV